VADWEAFIEWELDSDFIMTRVAIISLQNTSSKLRSVGKNKGKCSALADRCDIAAEKLTDRLKRKMTKNVSV
jgi:hypothetical protein